MRKRKCNKCDVEKDVEDFYKSKGSTSGYMNECKKCVVIRTSKHIKDNRERYNQYCRKWGEENPERRREISRDYYNKNTEKEKERLSKYKKKYPEKEKAHMVVRTATRNGKLKKRNICEICLNHENIEGHHSDYNKPLDVIWLCARCHNRLHIKLKNKNETKKY